MTVPLECQPISNQISGLEAERRRLQEELQHAAPQDKPQLIVEIKRLTREISEAHDALTECISSAPPIPPALVAQFVGTAEVSIPDVSPQAISSPISIDLLFDGYRTWFKIATFPPIMSSPFPTPLGSNVTTITLLTGGSGPYNSTSGEATIVANFLFDHSIEHPLPGYVEDSTLPVVLSTSPPGKPVDTAGEVGLAGGGTFNGGFLNGISASLKIVGKITPHP